MKAEELRKLTKKKSKTINLRINPDLLKLLDEAIAKDKDYDSRNELVEVLVLRYLESKGKI
jgi:metal-responsive CopG/Arc/MetJ family transcriptional regulator